MKLLASLLILTFVLAGCQTPEQAMQSRLDDKAREVRVGLINSASLPENTGPFEVLRNTKPERKYVEIAAMSLEGDAAEEAEAIGAFVQRARKLGAHGIVLFTTDAPNSNLAIAHPLWQDQGDRVFRAMAFTYAE